MIRNGLNKVRKFWHSLFMKKQQHAFEPPPPPRVKMHRLNVSRAVRKARSERRRHIKHMRRQKTNRRG